TTRPGTLDLPRLFGNGRAHGLGGRSSVKGFVLVVFAMLLALVGATVWWFKLEPGPPHIEFEQGKDVVGRSGSWDLLVQSRGHAGLKSIDVRLRSGGQTFPLYSEELPVDGPRVNERQLHVEADLAAAGVPQGPAQVQVTADTRAWHLLGGEH